MGQPMKEPRVWHRTPLGYSLRGPMFGASVMRVFDKGKMVGWYAQVWKTATPQRTSWKSGVAYMRLRYAKTAAELFIDQARPRRTA